MILRFAVRFMPVPTFADNRPTWVVFNEVGCITGWSDNREAAIKLARDLAFKRKCELDENLARMVISLNGSTKRYLEAMERTRKILLKPFTIDKRS